MIKKNVRWPKQITTERFVTVTADRQIVWQEKERKRERNRRNSENGSSEKECPICNDNSNNNNNSKIFDVAK